MSFSFNKFEEVQEYVAGRPHGYPRPATELEKQLMDEIEELKDEIKELNERIGELESEVKFPND
jgi:ubiquinone biosynthesis protein UbiJ